MRDWISRFNMGGEFFFVTNSTPLCGPTCLQWVETSWNVMAHAQEPNFVLRRNGRVHLNRRWRQFSRLLAAEVCTSAVVMLDTPCSEVVWRVLATHCIRQFPLQFPFPASACGITFQHVGPFLEISRNGTHRSVICTADTGHVWRWQPKSTDTSTV